MTTEITMAGAFLLALGVRHAAQLWLTRGKIAGARSGWASTVLLFVCYVTAMCTCLWYLAYGSPPVGAIASGLGLWVVAVSMRMWALEHLKEQFSSLIELRSDHRLVTCGPYAVVRHPLHLAFGLEVLSFAVAAWTYYAAIPALAVWIVIAVRNRTEDAALAAHFAAGSDAARHEYERYCSDVPGMDLVRGVARLVARRRCP
jgi:protein-S-isoprenylcysteine O-methyltransferase Ste14